MAASSSQTSLEDLVTCSICMERMKNPKHLQCQHAFCEDCLKNWITQPGNSRRSISCPVCRHVTSVRRGVHLLPTDIAVTRLLDMLNQQTQSRLLRLVCGKDGAAAIAFCESCSYHLCRDCVDHHVQNQTLWPHLLYLDDVCCSRHSGAVQDLYCQQCDKLGCRQCMTEQHEDHTITQLAEVAETNRDSMHYLLQSLKDVMNSAEEQPDLINMARLESGIKELKQRIQEHANKNHTAVNIWKKTILATLKQESDKLAKKVSGAESQMEACSSLVTFISRFLEQGSDYQLVAAFSATTQELHRLTASLDAVARRRRGGLTFVNDPVPQTYGILVNPALETNGNQQAKSSNESPISGTSEKSFHGSILKTTDFANNRPSTSSGRATTHQATSQGPSPTKTMEFDASVWQNDDIVMIKTLHTGHDQRLSHMVKSFDQWLQGKRDEDLEAPVTVFWCNQYHMLYVGTSGWWKPGMLCRFPSCTDKKTQTVMPHTSPKAVAVSEGFLIFASVGDHLELQTSLILRPLSTMQIRRLCYHHKNIKDPYGIAVTQFSEWLVVDHTHCSIGIYTFNDDQLFNIANYGSYGSGPGNFCAPTYICYDSMRYRFIVADTGNNRIQVFSMSGDYLWQADGSDSGRVMRRPRGLCLDGLGNILVADTGNKRIAMFGWQTGHWVRGIELDFMPHSITVDGRSALVAFLVVAGLKGKMPLIKTLRFWS